MKTIDLAQLAVKVMEAHGLEPFFPHEVEEQLSRINEPAKPNSKTVDQTHLLWCSIDNDDSLDLDQLTYAELGKDGGTTLYVAIADVDALVFLKTAIDAHASLNTTSVYTPARIFPMLPVKLSTNLTSLNEGVERVAIVVSVNVSADGDILNGDICQAVVKNVAKLTYNGVGGWLEGGPIPEKVKAVAGLEENLILQNQIAQKIRNKRHALGALTLDPVDIEAKVVYHPLVVNSHSDSAKAPGLNDRKSVHISNIDRLAIVQPRELSRGQNGDFQLEAGINQTEVLLEQPTQNLAQFLIENFMIAANHIIATKLLAAKIPSLRRVVKVPKNWPRIVEVAALLGEKLPEEPNAIALENFLVRRKKAAPEQFQDLSLTVVKLLGRGEYVVETAGDKPIGHFGLALKEYIHSTAPNRRYPDLISQRQYKALIFGKQNPYTFEEITKLAEHCTAQEDAVNKVERQLTKSAGALLLSSQIGRMFNGIITGVNEHGIWARVIDPPVEGKIMNGATKLAVGDKTLLELVSVDVERGFINFNAL